MQLLIEFTFDLISVYSNTQFLIEIIQYASLIDFFLDKSSAKHTTQIHW